MTHPKLRNESAWLAERPWDKALWHVAFMGGWLHFVTLALVIMKATGFLSLGWGVVFSPSLIYGSGILLIGSGYSLAALCWWVNSPDHAEQLCPEPRLRVPVTADLPGKKSRRLDPSRSAM